MRKFLCRRYGKTVYFQVLGEILPEDLRLCFAWIELGKLRPTVWLHAGWWTING